MFILTRVSDLVPVISLGAFFAVLLLTPDPYAGGAAYCGAAGAGLGGAGVSFLGASGGGVDSVFSGAAYAKNNN